MWKTADPPSWKKSHLKRKRADATAPSKILKNDDVWVMSARWWTRLRTRHRLYESFQKNLSPLPEYFFLNASTITENSFHRSDFLSGITESQAAGILNRGNRIRLQPGEMTAIHYSGMAIYKIGFLSLGLMRCPAFAQTPYQDQ